MWKRKDGRYIEVPHLLDGFMMLNRAPANDPDDVYYLDVSNRSLRYVVEDDLNLFTRLHTLRAGENTLPFAKLGTLPALTRLFLPFNQIGDLDLEMEGRFTCLEELDLSYNRLTHAAIIVLSTLPRLRNLDISSNGIVSLPTAALADLTRWQDAVIEYLLPAHVALLDMTIAAMKSKPEQVEPPAENKNEGRKFDKPIEEAAHSLDVGITQNEEEEADTAAGGSTTSVEASSGPNGTESVVDGTDSQQTEAALILEAAKLAVTIAEDEGEVVEDDVLAGEDEQEHESEQDNGEGSNLGQEEQAADSGDTFNATTAQVVPEESHHPEKNSSKEVLLPGALGSGPQSPPKTPIAFEMLENLNLENNKLHSVETLKILGIFPNLKVLNLSKNLFTSFAFFASSVPSTADDESSRTHHVSDALENPRSMAAAESQPNSFRKYGGFNKLVDLNISFNKVNDPAGLMGIVWLPAIRRTWIEGNPIVTKGGGKIVIKDSQPNGEYLGSIDFDPLITLPRVYGIEICDLAFQVDPRTQPHRYGTQPLLVRDGGAVGRRATARAAKPRMIGDILHRAPGGLGALAPLGARQREDGAFVDSSGLGRMVHRVEDVLEDGDRSGGKRWLRSGPRRRHGRMTEEEVRETVRAGRILTLRELKRMRAGKREELEAAERERQERVETVRRFEATLRAERERLEGAGAARGDGEDAPTANEDNGGGGAEAERNAEANEEKGKTDETEAKDEMKAQCHEKLQYDPTAVDPTFVTGVHITGDQLNPAEQSITESSVADSDSDSSASSDSTSTSSYSSTTSTASTSRQTPLPSRLPQSYNRRTRSTKPEPRFHPLPSTPHASLIALRHALHNPVSYWRVMEATHARPTFASKARAAATAAETADKDGDGRKDAARKQARRKNREAAEDRERRKKKLVRDGESLPGHLGRPPPGLVSPANTVWTEYAASTDGNDGNADDAASVNIYRAGGRRTSGGAQIYSSTATTKVHRSGKFGPNEAWKVIHELGLAEAARKKEEIMLERGEAEDSVTNGELSDMMESEKPANAAAPEAVAAEAVEQDDDPEPAADRIVDALEFRKQNLLKAAKRGPHRPKDEFDEMWETMAKVDEKILLIEADLASILSSDAMARHLPQSHRLFRDVQHEYRRVEKLYFDSATEKIAKQGSR